MRDGEAVGVVDLLDGDVEVAVEDGDLGRAGHELDEGVHQLLREALHSLPEPPDHRRLLRVPLVPRLAHQHLR